MTDEELSKYEGPSLPWRTGAPSASEVEMWAKTYPDSPGRVQPRATSATTCAPGPVIAGAWLCHDSAGALGDISHRVVLAAIEGKVYLRNGFAFWQPLDETNWAARSKWLPCRSDGIPIALLRRIALVDRVLDPNVPTPEPGEAGEAEAAELLARSGALAELAREIDDALVRMPWVGTQEPPAWVAAILATAKRFQEEGVSSKYQPLLDAIGQIPAKWANPSIGGTTVLDRLRCVIRQRDRGWEELDRRYVANEPGSSSPHEGTEDCPTYWDGCNCTVGALDHNIQRAERAERALKAATEALEAARDALLSDEGAYDALRSIFRDVPSIVTLVPGLDREDARRAHALGMAKGAIEVVRSKDVPRKGDRDEHDRIRALGESVRRIRADARVQRAIELLADGKGPEAIATLERARAFLGEDRS